MQQDTVDEDQLAREIAKKLGDTPGISYTDIASKAYNRGKSALAIKVSRIPEKDVKKTSNVFSSISLQVMILFSV